MTEATKQGFILATDLADYLVRKGVPFRRAHQVVGQIVQSCVQNCKELQDCTLDEFRNFHKAFNSDVFPLLDLSSAVNQRTSAGGTATSRVQEAIRVAQEALQVKQENLDGRFLKNHEKRTAKSETD